MTVLRMAKVSGPVLVALFFLLANPRIPEVQAQSVPVKLTCDGMDMSGDCIEGKAVLNAYRLDEESRRMADDRSLYNVGLETSSMSKVLQSNGYQQMDSNPNQWCRMNTDGTVQDCIVNDSSGELLNRYNPMGESTVSLVGMQGPISTFVDTMDEETYGDVVTNAVAADTSIVFSTWNMIESGVFGGIAQGMNQTSHFVSQRDQHTRTLLQQVENDPQTAYFYKNQVLSCLSRRLRETHGPGDIFRTTPLQAQLECMPDRTDTTLMDPTAGNPNLGNTFRLSDHPAHPSRAPGAMGPFTPRDNETLHFTDMLFNQLAWAQGGTMAVPSAGWEAVDRRRASWIQLYGDLRMQLIPHCLQYADANNRICAPGFENFSAQDLISEFIEPEGPPIGSVVVDTIGGSEWYLRVLTKRIWELMYWGQEMLCHFHNGEYWNGSNFVTLPPDANDPYLIYASGKQGAQDGDFWDDPDFWRGLNVMSIRGFRMTPLVFESLLALFKSEDKARVASTDVLDCDLLIARTAGGSSNFDNLMDSASCGAGSDCLEETLSLRHRATFFIALKLAYGQLMGTHIAARDFLYEQTERPPRPVVREIGEALIFNQAGTSELEQAYEANREQLIAFVEELFQLRAQQTGATGRVTGPYANPQSRSNMGPID